MEIVSILKIEFSWKILVWKKKNYKRNCIIIRILVWLSSIVGKVFQQYIDTPCTLYFRGGGGGRKGVADVHRNEARDFTVTNRPISISHFPRDFSKKSGAARVKPTFHHSRCPKVFSRLGGNFRIGAKFGRWTMMKINHRRNLLRILLW